MKTILSNFFIIFTISTLIGQENQGGQPKSFEFNLAEDIYTITTPIVDHDQMLREDRLLPEATELKEVYNSLDALYQLLSGKTKKKEKPVFDD